MGKLGSLQCKEKNNVHTVDFGTSNGMASCGSSGDQEMSLATAVNVFSDLSELLLRICRERGH